jgi:hypothetical protein
MIEPEQAEPQFDYDPTRITVFKGLLSEFTPDTFQTTETDEIVPTRSLAVRLPKDPLSINGQPYGFEVDRDRLGNLIAHHIGTNPLPDTYTPRLLEVQLGDSLPESVTGATPKDQLPAFDYKTGALHVVIPRELSDSRKSSEEIARESEQAINRSIDLGLNQNGVVKYKVLMRSIMFKAEVIASGITAEAFNASSSPDTVGGYMGRSIVAALIGLGSAVAITGAKSIYNNIRFEDDLAGVVHAAYDLDSRVLKRVGVKTGRDAYFEQPLIKVIPHQNLNDDAPLSLV